MSVFVEPRLQVKKSGSAGCASSSTAPSGYSAGNAGGTASADFALTLKL